jgi:uncharacterized protein
MMNPVVHFEMPAKDRKRMIEFYTKVFGWKTEQMGSDMMDYVVATTSETDESGRPKMPGTINGGFYQLTKGMKGEHPSFVISVEDIEEHIKKIKAAGGKVDGKPVEIPGIGKYVSFKDTEGNWSSILEPRMKPQKP